MTEQEMAEPKTGNGELSKRKREMLLLDIEIIAQGLGVSDAEANLKAAKEAAKGAREEFDGQVERLRELVTRLGAIQAGKPLEQHLPFEESSHPDVAAGADRPHGLPALETLATIHKSNTEIGETKLADVKVLIGDRAAFFTAKQLGALSEHYGVTTVSDFVAATIEDGDHWWEDLPGVGQAAAEKMTTLVAAFQQAAEAKGIAEEAETVVPDTSK